MLIHPTRFWNFVAKSYARSPVKDQTSYQYKLDKTAAHLQPEFRLFEFGCGTGSTALIHAPHVAHIDAIDFSSGMIGIAKAKAKDQDINNIRFQTSSFEDWPEPAENERYDVILAMSILHLVPNLDATLNRVVSMLKPGGRFFSSTVCIGDMGGLIKYALPPLAAIGLLPKIIPLTPDALTEKIAASGLLVEKVWQPDKAASVFITAQRPGAPDQTSGCDGD